MKSRAILGIDLHGHGIAARMAEHLAVATSAYGVLIGLIVVIAA